MQANLSDADNAPEQSDHDTNAEQSDVGEPHHDPVQTAPEEIDPAEPGSTQQGKQVSA